MLFNYNNFSQFIIWIFLKFKIIPVSTFCLGTWQIQRKKWKENLILELQTKTQSDPVKLPEK